MRVVNVSELVSFSFVHWTYASVWCLKAKFYHHIKTKYSLTDACLFRENCHNRNLFDAPAVFGGVRFKILLKCLLVSVALPSQFLRCVLFESSVVFYVCSCYRSKSFSL